DRKHGGNTDRGEHGSDREGEQERWDGDEYVCETHDHGAKPAVHVVPRDQAENHTGGDRHGEDDRDERQGVPETKKDSTQYVPAVLVGTENEGGGGGSTRVAEVVDEASA